MTPSIYGAPTPKVERGDEADIFDLAEAVGVADSAGSGSSRRRKRGLRRRWPWVTATVVLVAALLAAGGAYAVISTKAFTPSHDVVSVTGLTVPQATVRLRAQHLSLQVVHQRSSTTVPAGVILRMIPAAGTSMKQGTAVGVVVSSGPPPVAVPNLTGVTGDCAAVTSVLAAQGLKVACSHQNSMALTQGTVISWSPKGQAPLGSTVSVVVSSGPPIVTVPTLTGSTCAGATTTLAALGLKVTCTNAYSTTVPNGEVVSWSPTGTTPEGTTIAVVVSQGPAPVSVPNVIGMTVSDAITALEAVGLVPGTDQGPLTGTVFQTDPAQGTSVLKGSSVQLYSH